MAAVSLFRIYFSQQSTYNCLNWFYLTPQDITCFPGCSMLIDGSSHHFACCLEFLWHFHAYLYLHMGESTYLHACMTQHNKLMNEWLEQYLKQGILFLLIMRCASFNTLSHLTHWLLLLIRLGQRVADSITMVCLHWSETRNVDVQVWLTLAYILTCVH